MQKLLLYFIIIILLSDSNLFAQEEETIPGELHIAFVNQPFTWSFTVKIQAIGTVWDHNHYITSEYLGGEENYDQNCLDCWHASALSWFLPQHEPVLSLGLYEVGIWEGQNRLAWFYLDYRTSHLPEASYYYLDLKFDYDVTNKTLELVIPSVGSVVNGTYYTIWDLVEGIQHYSAGLGDYWENCLVAIASSDNHPRLIWGPHPDDNLSIDVISYNIYRAINTGSFSKIDEVNESTFEYEDENFTVGGSANAHYKVTANWEDAQRTQQETSSTNVVTIGVSLYKDRISSVFQSGYSLFQNYPNPFNPSTVIFYQTPVDNFVTLKVFDVLGREVTELVNTYKEAGTHSVEFNASELTSGIYFYKIQISNFIETRKLILQK